MSSKRDIAVLNKIEGLVFRIVQGGVVLSIREPGCFVEGTFRALVSQNPTDGFGDYVRVYVDEVLPFIKTGFLEDTGAVCREPNRWCRMVPVNSASCRRWCLKLCTWSTIPTIYKQN